MGTDPLSDRANIYIDGFNLYHGCFDDHRNRPHWRQYRWLDLEALSQQLCQRASINRIRYFTALVDPYPSNPDNRARQLNYLRALATIPHLSTHWAVCDKREGSATGHSSCAKAHTSHPASNGARH